MSFNAIGKQVLSHTTLPKTGTQVVKSLGENGTVYKEVLLGADTRLGKQGIKKITSANGKIIDVSKNIDDGQNVLEATKRKSSAEILEDEFTYYEVKDLFPERSCNWPMVGSEPQTYKEFFNTMAAMRKYGIG